MLGLGHNHKHTHRSRYRRLLWSCMEGGIYIIHDGRQPIQMTIACFAVVSDRHMVSVMAGRKSLPQTPTNARIYLLVEWTVCVLGACRRRRRDVSSTRRARAHRKPVNCGRRSGAVTIRIALFCCFCCWPRVACFCFVYFVENLSLLFFFIWVVPLPLVCATYARNKHSPSSLFIGETRI